jgi:tRNA threonylcarbamoyladenosine biosynthesis protein TsaB
MIILTLRTDKPEAEIGLYNSEEKIDYYTWTAHMQLAETIHLRIEELLKKNKLEYKDLEALAIFKGPGSFTGLRIGFSVANAFSYGLHIPVVTEPGDNWIEDSIKRLLNNQNDYVAMPEYGAEPHITKPKK